MSLARRSSRTTARAGFRPRVEGLEDRWTPATLTVTTLADAGAGSLRQAILDANDEAANPGSDTITFTGAAAGGTINLTTVGGTQFGPNALEVTSTIVITGTGETIARGGAAPNFRLFFVSTAGNLTLTNVTLSNGAAVGGNGGTNLGDDGGGGGGGLGAGGAVYNQGTVTITSSTLTGNKAVGGNGGNGADNAGTDAGGGGGGGGMGGNGGNVADNAGDGGGGGGGFGGTGGLVAGTGGGGSGGGGTTTNGGDSTTATGGTGGTANGGTGGAANANGANGGLGGGGGGAGDEATGGAGGVGGGGGGGGENDDATPNGGGAGGFGGGGGGGGEDGAGGAGGFGGGGGGAATSGGGTALAGGAGGTFGGTGGSSQATRGSGGGGGGAGLGGAIFNDGGTVTISSSTITTNTATGGTGGTASGTASAGSAGQGAGGGVFNHAGTVTFTGSTVSTNTAANDGGGVNVTGPGTTLVITNSTITGNTNTDGDGGGVFAGDGSTVTITDTRITANTGSTGQDGAGIRVSTGATVTLTDSTVANNTGTGTSYFGAGIRSDGTLTVTRTTFSGNTSGGRGGAVSITGGTATFTNTTFNGNTANGSNGGGGLQISAGTVTITNSTITNNTDTTAAGNTNRSGGVSVSAGTVTMANTVVANNTTSDGAAPDVRGTFAAGSNNNFIRIGDAALVGITNGTNGNKVGTAGAPIDPLLGPLQNNGGPTQTRLPQAGSPLIDAGSNAAVPAGTTFDQRGPGYVRIVNTVDIGAVEVQPPFPLAVSGLANGTVLKFVPNAAGTYAATPAATLAPFGGLGTNVRAAAGDVNGDGFADIAVITGPGTAVRLAVISGVDNTTTLIAPFDPFGDPNFTGGGFVSTGDFDNDGRDEVVVTPDQGGGPRVVIFSLVGTTTTQKASFFGIDDPNFRGGARSSVGDFNGDGTVDLVVAAGFLGGPRVALFDGKTVFGGAPAKLVGDFFAFPGSDAVTLRNGAFVAAGDVDGDGFADLIAGGGPGGAPRILTISGKVLIQSGSVAAQAAPLMNFFVAGNDADRGGVRVTATDADGDNRADVAAGSGEGSPSKVRVYLGKNITTSAEPTTFQDLDPFGGAVLSGGVFVG